MRCEVSTIAQYNMYYLIDHFIEEDHFEIIHMNAKDEEVWLEKVVGNRSKVIRLIYKGFDWTNQLKKDVAQVFQRTIQIKDHLKKRRVDIFNVYVTIHEPVDDWRALREPLRIQQKNNLRMNVFYLSDENLIIERDRLLKQINSSINPQIKEPKDSEREVLIELYKLKFISVLRERQRQLRATFTYGKPRFIYFLIVSYMALFFLFEWGVNEQIIVDGLTKYFPIFLEDNLLGSMIAATTHIGFIHLFFNLIVLYYLGSHVEKIYGSIRTIIIYISSGLGIVVVSVVFGTSELAGASGAIFGLIGALFFFSLMYKELFYKQFPQQIILIIGINLVMLFYLDNVNVVGHFTGLVLGFLMAGIVALPNKANRKISLYFLLIASIIMFGFIFRLYFY